jgi:hypothetical protein
MSDKTVLKGEVIVRPAKALGPHRKLTPTLQEDICGHIREGVFGHVAAQMCGISARIFFYWMEEDRYPEPEYVEFRAAVMQAKAQARGEAEKVVFKEAGLAWLLKGPGKDAGEDNPGWANSVALTGKAGGPVQVETENKTPNDKRRFDLSNLSPDDIRKLRDIRAKLIGVDGPE